MSRYIFYWLLNHIPRSFLCVCNISTHKVERKTLLKLSKSRSWNRCNLLKLLSSNQLFLVSHLQDCRWTVHGSMPQKFSQKKKLFNIHEVISGRKCVLINRCSWMDKKVTQKCSCSIRILEQRKWLKINIA